LALTNWGRAGCGGICKRRPFQATVFVGGDDALLLHAQDIAPLRFRHGQEGAGLVRRLGGEAGVVGRQIDVAVGRFDVR